MKYSYGGNQFSKSSNVVTSIFPHIIEQIFMTKRTLNAMSMISTAILEIRKREMVLQNFAMVMGRVVENMGFGKTRIQTIADMCLKCFHLVC